MMSTERVCVCVRVSESERASSVSSVSVRACVRACGARVSNLLFSGCQADTNISKIIIRGVVNTPHPCRCCGVWQ